MTQKIFESRVREYAIKSNLDFNSLKDLLTPCNEALEWRRKKSQTSTNQKAFRKNINYMLNNLLELHNIIADEGNKKLVKRCKELLKHLDRYEDKKLLAHSKMDNYFKIIFFKDIPTEQNIINLTRLDIEDRLYRQSIQSTYDNRINKSTTKNKLLAPDYVADLLKAIFGISPTNHTPLYHKIIMIKNKKPIVIGEYTFTNHTPIEKRKEEIKTFKFELK